MSRQIVTRFVLFACVLFLLLTPIVGTVTNVAPLDIPIFQISELDPAANPPTMAIACNGGSGNGECGG